MEIVITDGYALNPGDLSWEDFYQLGEVKYYDRTSTDTLIERCKNASVIVTNKTAINASAIEALEKLKLIVVTATGYNVIDIKAAADKGIPVCNVPVYGTDSVAQHVFALLLELSNHTGRNAASVAQGNWSTNPDWCYTVKPVMELKGKLLGIVGFGRIGQRVASIASAFGMEVAMFNKGKTSMLARNLPLEELFEKSDVITLHCPLTDDNAGFVNKELLSRMKPTSFLINTARGQLINEAELANALRNRTIAGAALDVLSKEPPPSGHPLIGLENCLVTPHNAWISFEARERLMKTTVENIRAFKAGRIQNQVN